MADLQLSGVAPVVGAGSAAVPVATAAASAAGNAGLAAAAPLAGISPKAPEAGADTAGDGKSADPPSPAAPSADSEVKAAAKAAVKGANAALAASGTLLVFVFDDQAHNLAVKLLDVQTQKVVQRIPLQLMPAMASALAGDSHSGGLVDTTA